ncbi:MAG: methionine--tRNA ligase [Acidobacteriota bacterium]|nr:methionine--tRNA ligase [Acidobacteriota bacterium]
MSETQKTTPNTFYLTTPIYYVNARPHIGHAYTTLAADVIARRHRLLGDDTFLLTGTDEHGQKIERSASAAGIPPQQFADQVSASFRALWDRMGITYDGYIRTTSDAHKRGVQQLFRTLYQNGHIYLDSYTGAYCVSDENFVDLPVGTPCPDCGRLLEEVTEENFFFKLSEWGERVAERIESKDPETKLDIQPESRRNEVLSFVKGGLKDLSISRSSFTWGIPVPDDIQQDAGAAQKHVVYVWLDALANYITALGYGSDAPEDIARFEKYWPADLHLVGKEIIRFHCVYWPAFLLAAGLKLPKAITAHGWLLFEESKMSKSKGNIVRAETILDAFGSLLPDASKTDRDLFGTDVLRYFLLREIPFGQDGSFSFDAVVTRYNAELANGYGNLVSRTLNLIAQNRESRVPEYSAPSSEWDNELWLGEAHRKDASSFQWSELNQEAPAVSQGIAPTEYRVLQKASFLIKNHAVLYNKYIFGALLAEIQLLITITDGFISNEAPWKLAKQPDEKSQKRLSEVLYTAAESIRIITALLYPILPFATAKVWAQLGLGDIHASARKGELTNLQWGGLKPGTKLGPLAPIFPRAPKELIQTMIDIEQSTNATKVEKAEKPNGKAVELPHINTSHDATSEPPVEFGETPLSSLSAHPELNAIAETQHPASSHPAQPRPDTSQITIDDFVKVDLRVAQVLVAERIPKADKLLRLEVDLGYEKRQILSGIAEWYTPEELIGRRIVVIANLAPRKMRGLESHGMLLAASEGENGKPVLATFGEEIALGSRLR